MQSLNELVLKRFPLFIGLYFVLQIIIRLLITDGAVLDEAEQLALSQYFAWGYNQQPPLYTWLQMAVFKITGVSVLGLAFLKNGFLFLLYLYLYRTGLLLSGDRNKAALGALSLLLLPQIVWGAQVDQIHTVMLTSATAMTIYYFCRIATRTPTMADFLLLGLAGTLGLLAKYNFVLVIAGLLLTALVTPGLRGRFFEKRGLLTVALALAAAAPHFWWLISHLELATDLTARRMGVSEPGGALVILQGLASLAEAVLAFLAPFALIFAIFFSRDLRRGPNPGAGILLRYLLAVSLLLLLVVVGGGVTNIKERWLQPYLYLFPLWLFLQTRVEENTPRVRSYVTTCLSVALLVALIMVARPLLTDLRGKPSRANYPFAAVAQELSSLIENQKEVLIHAEDNFIAGNLRLFIPNIPVINPDLPLQPYQVKPEVIFVYERQPPELLADLKGSGFNCREIKSEIPFRHSRKQYYRLHYQVCFTFAQTPSYRQ